MNVNDLLDARTVTHSIEDPTPKLRWVLRQGERVLQQQHTITDWCFDRPVGARGEWRDVQLKNE